MTINSTDSKLFYSDKESLQVLLMALWGKLSNRRKQQLGLLIILIIVTSIAEMISLASIIPFLAVLASPDALWRQDFVQSIAIIFGINGPEELLLPITIGFALTVIISGTIRILNIKFSQKLTAGIGSDISCEAYRRTLFQPYSVHLSRNSSEVIASLITDVNKLVGDTIFPIISLASSLFIIVGLSATLLAISWQVAIGIGGIIFVVYTVAVQKSKKVITALGNKKMELSRDLIRGIQEAQGAIRDVLLDSSQEFYASIHSQVDRPLRLSGAQINFLTAYPKMALESAGMVLIAIAGYILVIQGGVTKALPLLGSLALGAQRLLPLAQRVYECWALLKSSKKVIANVLTLLSKPIPKSALTSLKVKKLGLKEKIEFKNVNFTYKKGLRNVLEGFNITILKGERIGFIGKTGCGKSTAVDLLMGLLLPTKGKILVDGKDLYDSDDDRRVSSWRASLAHVPQSIYLTDASIAENIAFGIPTHEIDMDRVKRASEMSMLDKFAKNSPQGYSTIVGERGVRLSGGQRQRIGIARALYKNAEVIIFDEATSALDNTTESQVMESINNLSSNLTIILIAHRESTLVGCDKVFKIENGSAKHV